MTTGIRVLAYPRDANTTRAVLRDEPRRPAALGRAAGGAVETRDRTA